MGGDALKILLTLHGSDFSEGLNYPCQLKLQHSWELDYLLRALFLFGVQILLYICIKIYSNCATSMVRSEK